MCTLYDNIISLCNEHGIKGGKMCVDIGVSKSLLTDLKSGRKKTINADTAKKIANYFGVNTDRVLYGPSKKAPTQEGERVISDDDIKFALFGTREIDDDVLEQVKSFAKFARENRKDK